MFILVTIRNKQSTTLTMQGIAIVGSGLGSWNYDSGGGRSDTI